MATLTTIDGLLKDKYTRRVEQLNNSVFMLSQVEKNSERTDGRRAIHSVHLTRSRGVGAASEGAVLPSPGGQGHKQVPVPVRLLYGTFSLSGPMLELADSDTGSFADAMENEMSGIQDDWRRDTGRQVWGTSNGVLATCGVTSASTTVVLHTTKTTATQMRQVWNDGGMVVDIGTVATPTSVASARNVTGFAGAYGSYTITISGAAVTTAVTDFLFRAGNGGASDNSGVIGDGQKELTGLQTIVDAADTLHTLTVASNPNWAAQEYANGGTLREVTEQMVTKGVIDCGIKGASNSMLLVTAEGVHLKLQALFTSMKRVMGITKLPGGAEGIQWSIPAVNKPGGFSTALVIDYDCPGQALYGIDPSSLVFYEASPVGWIDKDGSILHLVTATGPTMYDNYIGGLRAYVELACYRRNTNFKVVDLTEVT